MILGKQFEGPSLLTDGIKEKNHVDESVCHLQDGSFQTSLGREGALPVWVGMGWLGPRVEALSSSRSDVRHHHLTLIY